MEMTGFSILTCPACQRIIQFKSAFTNLQACTCGAAIYRDEKGLLAEKPVGIIQQPGEVIKPGTTGKYEGVTFSVLGRIRCWFAESVFNYWTIEWNDNSTGYIAESYGLFYLLRPVSIDQLKEDELKNANPGASIELMPKKKFLVEKKQTCQLREFEGETWLPDLRTAFSITDTVSVTGKSLTFFQFGNDTFYCFEVVPAEPEELDLNDLRQNTGVPKHFACPQCAKPVVVHSFPLAQSCVCCHCGHAAVFRNAIDFKKTGDSYTSTHATLPLGAEGRLKGQDWKIIGYCEKEEKNSFHSKWREYTLYNAFAGFAFLSEYDGHWIFLREKSKTPVLLKPTERDITVEGKTFEIYNNYTYKVVEAQGEFPYNLFNNEHTNCREYIAPPYIWIQEKDKKEGVCWFFGEHISPAEIRKAFPGVKHKYRIGVGAVQPVSVPRPALVKATLVGFILVLLVHYLSTAGALKQQLFSDTWLFPDSVNTVSATTQKFDFTKNKANLKLEVFSPVSNSWFELSATLVNAENGKEYALDQGVEYYAGYSEGESWTEGSTTENAWFTRIPRGTYFLQLAGTRDSGVNKPSDFTVTAIYDVPGDRNLWFTILLYFICPVLLFIISGYRETERWRNSPYVNS